MMNMYFFFLERATNKSLNQKKKKKKCLDTYSGINILFKKSKYYSTICIYSIANSGQSLVITDRLGVLFSQNRFRFLKITEYN